MCLFWQCCQVGQAFLPSLFCPEDIAWCLQDTLKRKVYPVPVSLCVSHCSAVYKWASGDRSIIPSSYPRVEPITHAQPAITSGQMEEFCFRLSAPLFWTHERQCVQNNLTLNYSLRPVCQIKPAVMHSYVAHKDYVFVCACLFVSLHFWGQIFKCNYSHVLLCQVNGA